MTLRIGFYTAAVLVLTICHSAAAQDVPLQPSDAEILQPSDAQTLTPSDALTNGAVPLASEEGRAMNGGVTNSTQTAEALTSSVGLDASGSGSDASQNSPDASQLSAENEAVTLSSAAGQAINGGVYNSVQTAKWLTDEISNVHAAYERYVAPNPAAFGQTQGSQPPACIQTTQSTEIKGATECIRWR